MMRSLSLSIVTVVVLLSVGDAQERVTLTTPETAPAIQAYRIATVTLIADNPSTPAADGFLYIGLEGVERPVSVTCSYGPETTPTGTVLITGLNKANLASAYAGNATTGSLKQRIFHRLVVLGESAAVCSAPLAGTLSGAVP